MITLTNFESHITPLQLEKGLEYFTENQVKNATFDEQGQWTASVHGSSHYQVSVAFSDEEVTATACDCAHEHPFCRHIVALLYFLQHRSGLEPSSQPQKKTRIIQRKVKDFAGMVNAVDEIQLRKFLVDYGRQSSEFRNLFTARFAALLGGGERSYSSIIKELIRASRDRNGLIPYQRVTSLVSSIREVLQQARLALEKREYTEAFNMAFAIIAEVHKSLEIADDSTGSLGDGIREAFEVLLRVAQAETGYEFREKMFSEILKHAGRKEYEADDFFHQWMDVLAILALDENMGHKLIRLYDRKLSTAAQQQNTRAQYLLAESKTKWLVGKGDRAGAERVYLENQHLPPYRKKRVEEFISSQRFREAKELIEEARSDEQKLPVTYFNVNWDDILLGIHALEKDEPAFRTLALKLYLQTHRMEYLRRAKATCAPEAWKKEMQNLVAYLSRRQPDSLPVHQLAEIYVEESLYEKLLALVQKNQDLDFIERCFPVLRERYPGELLLVYRNAIRRSAERAVGKTDYFRLAEVLQKLLGIPGGKDLVQHLAIELKVKYRNRPAFVKELNKVVP